MNRRGQFDRVAWCYDRLASVVFGRSMVASQTHFFHCIPAGSSILVLGGGTGWVLEELAARAGNCEIWFVEASEEMLKRAKRRHVPAKVRFVHGSWDDLPANEFDVVVTNYFLDLFNNNTLNAVVAAIGASLKPGGIWLVAEFTRNRPWHRVMLGAMYLFFALLCRIEAWTLPAWEEAMLRAGFRVAGYKYRYAGFMKSVLFKR